MQSAQDRTLQASFATMAAHAQSSSLSTRHSTAPSSTNSREYVTSTTTNLVDTSARLAKDAGEMFKDIPYIKAVAGIIIQIITIRDVRFKRSYVIIFPYPSPPGNQNSKGAIS